MKARKFIAQWLHDMDWPRGKWRDVAPEMKLHYLVMADEYMAEPENMILRAEAWSEGHRSRWRRDPNDGCRCGAWARIECGCGKYGTGTLLSLKDNPYLAKQEPVDVGLEKSDT